MLAYRDRIRTALPEIVGAPAVRDVVPMVLEHELMHHETLLYMLQQLPADIKRPLEGLPDPPETPAPERAPALVPAGPAVLGASRDGRFRWGNEHPELAIAVPEFRIDTVPVTNREFRRFAEDGGYEDRRLWSDAPPRPEHGNLGFQRWSPAPVGSHPEGASAFGIHELVGNGWEWTSTPFGPFPGFEPLQGYEGYSADFFDDRHFVMLGASWATDASLVRRSFRNWFPPRYPYVFSKFRCVRED